MGRRFKSSHSDQLSRSRSDTYAAVTARSPKNPTLGGSPAEAPCGNSNPFRAINAPNGLARPDGVLTQSAHARARKGRPRALAVLRRIASAEPQTTPAAGRIASASAGSGFHLAPARDREPGFPPTGGSCVLSRAGGPAQSLIGAFHSTIKGLGEIRRPAP